MELPAGGAAWWRRVVLLLLLHDGHLKVMMPGSTFKCAQEEESRQSTSVQWSLHEGRKRKKKQERRRRRRDEERCTGCDERGGGGGGGVRAGRGEAVQV